MQLLLRKSRSHDVDYRIAVQHADDGYYWNGNFDGLLVIWFHFIRQMVRTCVVQEVKSLGDRVSVWVESCKIVLFSLPIVRTLAVGRIV